MGLLSKELDLIKGFFGPSNAKDGLEALEEDIASERLLKFSKVFAIVHIHK